MSLRNQILERGSDASQEKVLLRGNKTAMRPFVELLWTLLLRCFAVLQEKENLYKWREKLDHCVANAQAQVR